MDEQRLPFPIHGTRLTGDGDPQRGVGEAARLLYFANLIAQTAGVPVYRLSRQTPYGQVTASVHGSLAFKTVHSVAEPEEPQEEEVTGGSARLVWLPEGFVITPRTAGAPYGFGMPPTPDGKGTPGGPLRQVIINRFKDNQYPDAVYRLAGGSGGGTVFAANLFFMDWEMSDPEFGIGIMEGEGDDAKLRPQFSQRWATNYREAKSDDWHCHRPQHHLQESDLEALIRQETNLIREEAGKPPLGKPLRGTVGELSQNIAYQIRYSGKFGHDNTMFREGHQTFEQRIGDRTAYTRTGGENLYYAQVPADAAFAHLAMGGWANSAEHYLNMVKDWAESEDVYGWIDSAVTGAGKMGSGGGSLGVQIFHGAREWVDSGPGAHGGKPPVTLGASSTNEQRMFTPIYRGRAGEVEGWPAVSYRGRSIYITDEPVSGYIFEALSATVIGDDDGAETKLRIAVLHLPDDLPGRAYFVLYEGAIYDFAATRKEVVRYELPQSTANQISTPVWSETGEKVAFCYTTLSPVPAGRIQGGISNPRPTTFVGQQLHFVEVVGGVLSLRGTDQLQVDPTDFSPRHRRSSCRGTARLLPVYSGEVLQYVSIEVDSFVYFSAERFEKRIYGALVFPDGARVVYADQHSLEVMGGEQKPVKGFVRHILPFDVSDPTSVAYIQYDHPEKSTDAGISAHLIIRGMAVKYSPLAYDSGVAGPEYRNQFSFDATEYSLDSFRGTPHSDPYYSKGFSFFGTTSDKYNPSVAFDGVIVGDGCIYPPSRLGIGPPGAYRGPVATSPFDTSYVLLGPTLLRDGVPTFDGLDEDGFDAPFPRVERFQYVLYGGDWIYAGRIENTLGGTGEFTSIRPPTAGGTVRVVRSAWVGDDQYYCHSSLDLKALTGLPDLKDNILPIGVL